MVTAATDDSGVAVVSVSGLFNALGSVLGLFAASFEVTR